MPTLLTTTNHHFDAKAFLQTLTTDPGVYQMMNAAREVIYVGKAKNLKKRVASYFQKQHLNAKTVSLVRQIQHIEIIITNSESEALLLENNLIKKFRPRYNVSFRDDKSYPYIYLSKHPTYPRLEFRRGAKQQEGRYFGPYPSSRAVRESLQLMQKLFQIRQCDDNFFRNRSRPCLQYHIKRCSAPCVNLIAPEDYQRDVRDAVLFLEGKNQQVINSWALRMEDAAARLNFELAAKYRDQIGRLRRIQERQFVDNEGNEVDIDVIAGTVKAGAACIQVLFIRGGRLLGNRVYYPKIPADTPLNELFANFIPQFYLSATLINYIPREIIANVVPADKLLLESVLAEQSHHPVKISHQVRSKRAQWVKIAEHNAQQSLASYLAGKLGMQQRFEALQEELGLENLPQRMECFDISHTMGEATVASCVVFDSNGPVKSDYRRYNINGITQSDDYAAMYQALTRRYQKLKDVEGKIPDIIFIDGGKGQLAQAEQVIRELQVTGVTLIAIAKGLGRKAGLETLFMPQRGAIVLPPDSMALHLIQYIRDQAHEFAITGHRQRRAKARNKSSLEAIPGVGATRRRELLRLFGGLQEVKRASIEELAKVPGISRALAQKIYDYLRSE